MNCTTDGNIFVRVLSCDWESACLSFATGGAGFVSAELSPGNITAASVEAADCGRLYFRDLESDTEYNGVFRCDKGEVKFAFRTLKRPAGKMLGHFAIISDPHISLKPENRKGRYFIESAFITADVIRQCRDLGCKYTLWPGDITNSGSVTEYELAAEVFKGCPAKPLVIPGNHDHMENPEAEAAFLKHFGPRQWSVELPGIGTVVGLDTGNKTIDPQGAQLLANALEKNSRIIVITHFQLFPSPWINHAGGSQAHIVKNASEYSSLLDKLAGCDHAVVYSGHQNITTLTRLAKAAQLNLPQPVQYPCGFIYVRCFEDGFYHTFMPIASEVMNQWSRIASKEAARFYNEPQWDESYRCGSGVDQSNFFLPLK